MKFNKRSGSRSRRDLSEEMGVRSGYQVISEVDLAFKPSFEDGMGVTVFQARASNFLKCIVCCFLFEVL